MNLLNRNFLIFFGTLILLACKNENTPTLKPFRTVLVYIAANNNLSHEASLNIEQMANSIDEVNGNLIVYARLPNSKPALYHISNNKGERKKIKIKEYEQHNSSDPNVLNSIISEIVENYKADTYGLILWSHATGWLPSNVNIKLKSFGNDDGSEMDIKKLNKALPPIFDFILFDACSMASIEVLYELKDKSKYFIASPGEVIANGMPYNKVINDFFEQNDNTYQNIAKKYFDHYNNMSGLYRSATVSVIDGKQLISLANQTKQILFSQQPKYKDFSRSTIQRMDFDRSGNPLIAFDFQDFIEINYNNSNSSFEYKKFNELIGQTVIYSANTPYFNGYKIDKNSGITCYIPLIENEHLVHEYYRTLSWYEASGFNMLF